MNCLVKADPIGSYSSGNRDVIGHVICDDVSDLPAATDFSGVTLKMDSIADIIANGDRYKMNSSGTWVLQPSPMTTQLDLSGYYTSAETDTAISTALSDYTDTTGMTAAIAAANYFLRGSQITSPADSPFDVFSITTAGSWYYGASAATTMVNLPPSAPTTAGGQIRVKENQGTNRLLMELTVNSVPLSGVVFRCWYTASGGGSWGSWYRFDGVVDT